MHYNVICAVQTCPRDIRASHQNPISFGRCLTEWMWWRSCASIASQRNTNLIMESSDKGESLTYLHDSKILRPFHIVTLFWLHCYPAILPQVYSSELRGEWGSIDIFVMIFSKWFTITTGICSDVRTIHVEQELEWLTKAGIILALPSRVAAFFYP